MIVGQLAAVAAETVRRSDLGRHLGAPAVLDERAHDARLDQRSAVGDRADRRGHLQRRHADLISHRHRRERARIELRGVPDDAGVLAAEVRSERLAEAEPADVAAEPLRAEPQSRP